MTVLLFFLVLSLSLCECVSRKKKKKPPMKMTKNTTLINVARPERGERCLRFSVREQTSATSLMYQRVTTLTAGEEQSVVIMLTLGQSVDDVAELVFDMMFHSEFEVVGRRCAFYPSCMPVTTPRTKEYDSSAGCGPEEVRQGQCRDGSKRLSHDLRHQLRRQLASQVSTAHQQAPQVEDKERTTHFQKRVHTPVPSSARESSIEKKLTVYKFHKQSAQRGNRTLLRKSSHCLYKSISQL